MFLKGQFNSPCLSAAKLLAKLHIISIPKSAKQLGPPAVAYVSESAAATGVVCSTSEDLPLV